MVIMNLILFSWAGNFFSTKVELLPPYFQFWFPTQILIGYVTKKTFDLMRCWGLLYQSLKLKHSSAVNINEWEKAPHCLFTEPDSMV